MWPGLSDLFPIAAKQLDVEVIKRRFLYVQALDTIRCLGEGVIEYPADADLGSVLGIGYPAWTGGAVSFIDTVGLSEFVRNSSALALSYGARFNPPKELIHRAQENLSFHDKAGQPWNPAA